MSIFLLSFVSLVVFSFWAASLRRVVPSNEVHIVQTSKKTISYGTNTSDNVGNTYYEWPTKLPILGVQKIVLQTSVFDLDLQSYEAYDIERLPFLVDVKAFFRICDSNTAASRVSSFPELQSQLLGIVQGAVRSIMANSELGEIMSQRSVYGQRFTEEVEDQLKSWGVTTVKNIELMDIRDAASSKVIHNIMAKKQSFIEMQSRVEVAKNGKLAQEAEILATQDIRLKDQESRHSIGLKIAEVDKEIGIATESSRIEVLEKSKETKTKEMQIVEIEQTKMAEITKQAGIIKAEELKQSVILKAEADLELKKKTAEGDLEVKRLNAEGTLAEGKAIAESEKLLQLAPVEAQITLAKEIGTNGKYQEYLTTMREIEAKERVGVTQASNLSNADLKIIANSGDVSSGINNIMDIFSSKGGLGIGAALEALGNTDAGKSLLNKFTGVDPSKGV